MKQYDSIIFDLDGTLWDATKASAIAWNNVLLKYDLSSYSLTQDDIRKTCGLPYDLCFQALSKNIEKFDIELLKPMIDEEERQTVIRLGGDLYSGVAEGIPELSKKYQLFLVSNCQSWYLKAFWRQFNFMDHFKDHDCYGDSGVSKTEMLKKFSKLYALKNTIYIGDTFEDLQSAQDAKIDFGYASYGFGEVPEPSISFNSFYEILDFFIER